MEWKIKFDRLMDHAQVLCDPFYSVFFFKFCTVGVRVFQLDSYEKRKFNLNKKKQIFPDIVGCCVIFISCCCWCGHILFTMERDMTRTTCILHNYVGYMKTLCFGVYMGLVYASRMCRRMNKMLCLRFHCCLCFRYFLLRLYILPSYFHTVCYSSRRI